VVAFHPQELVRDTPRIRKLSGLNPDVICPIPMRLGMSCPGTGIGFRLHFPSFLP
jgi:hypothetical protein